MTSVDAEYEALRLKVTDLEFRLGFDHPDTVNNKVKFLMLQSSKGYYKEAIFTCREILRVHQRVFGCEHENSLRALSNLATLYHIQGHYVEAERIFNEVLEIQEHILDPKHPETLHTKCNIARCLIEQGKYRKADQLIKNVVEDKIHTSNLTIFMKTDSDLMHILDTKIKLLIARWHYLQDR